MSAAITPPNPTFVERQLSATFTLANGVYAESGTNQVTLSGLRMSAHIIKAGGNSMGETTLRINGMTLSLMNQLSTLGKIPLSVPKNVLSISAGDAVNGMSVVFIGTIYTAFADFEGAPDTAFHAVAQTGLYEAVNPTTPGSFNGPTDAADIMAGIAQKMGVVFENNGVSVILASPYFRGTLWTQAQQCARAGNFNMLMDNGVLAIWPKGGSRSGAAIMVSPQTGMVGYPTFTSKGIVLKMLFNRNVHYGSRIQVQSSLTPACGIWAVYNLSHELEAQVPDGAWFTRIEAANPLYVPIS